MRRASDSCGETGRWYDNATENLIHIYTVATCSAMVGDPVMWTKRNRNRSADAMANIAMDRQDVVTWIHE